MSEHSEHEKSDEINRVLVEFESLEGVTNTVSGSPDATGEEDDERIYPELQPVLDAITDAFHGLQMATEEDERGRMRHIVQEHAGREDMHDGYFGSHLRVLEKHGLAEQEGKRWRVSPNED